MVPVTAATNIEQLTVELIFRRLSNAEVLGEVRKVFPGRATMSTVAWYRTHLIHDKSLRFERLAAGRIPSRLDKVIVPATLLAITPRCSSATLMKVVKAFKSEPTRRCRSIVSTMSRPLRAQTDALAQVAVGQFDRIGDVRAGGLHAEDGLGDRLEVGSEMDGGFERQDRYSGRLDPDMTEHLLVDRLDAAAGEHRRDAAFLVGN